MLAKTLRIEKLQEAEDRYRDAVRQTGEVLDKIDFMSPSDGQLALEKALKSQNDAMDTYYLLLEVALRT